MTLTERIKTDLINAQKAGDVSLVAILKLLWSEVGYLLVDKKGDDPGVLAMLKREAKKRKESIEIYQKAGEKGRTENERYELGIIEAYLAEETREG